MNKTEFRKALRIARAIKDKGQNPRRVAAWFQAMKAALKGDAGK